MNIDEYKQGYLNAGFFWNDILESMVRSYQGRATLSYNHFKTKVTETMVLFDVPWILGPNGRRYGTFDRLAEYFGEDVARVGVTQDLHMQFHLTESGRFFGFAFDMMFQWGSDTSWTPQMDNLLSGSEPAEIGYLE